MFNSIIFTFIWLIRFVWFTTCFRCDGISWFSIGFHDANQFVCGFVDMVKTSPSVDNATSFFGRSGGTSASNNSAQCEDQGSKSNEVCIFVSFAF